MKYKIQNKREREKYILHKVGTNVSNFIETFWVTVRERAREWEYNESKHEAKRERKRKIRDMREKYGQNRKREGDRNSEKNESSVQYKT